MLKTSIHIVFIRLAIFNIIFFKEKDVDVSIDI